LYEPVRWKSSAFNRTSNPVRSDNTRDVSNGVCLTWGSIRARAAAKSLSVGAFIDQHYDLPEIISRRTGT
jgi:hypothetical protein